MLFLYFLVPLVSASHVPCAMRPAYAMESPMTDEKTASLGPESSCSGPAYAGSESSFRGVDEGPEQSELLMGVQESLRCVDERHTLSDNAGFYEPEIMDLNVFTKPRQTMSECGEMIKEVYNTARKWAIITSYQVRPGSGFDPKGTATAVWESIIKNWDEPKVMIYAYHRTHFSDAAGCFPDILKDDMKSSKGWNRSIVKKLADYMGERMVWPKKAGFGKSKVIFVELSPIGMCGSWHTKFLINDQGLMGTTGCSIGNKAKPGWTDSGLLSFSPDMASQEKDLFLNHILRHAKNIGRAEFIKKRVVAGPNALKFSRGFEFREITADDVRKLFVSPPRLDSDSADEKEADDMQAQICARMETDQKKCRGMMIRNFGSKAYTPAGGLINPTKRPIGAMMDHLFAQVQEGDTVWLRSGCPINMAPVFTAMQCKRRYLDWICDSMRRGAHVKLLYNDQDKDNRIKTLFKDILDILCEGRDELRPQSNTNGIVDPVGRGTFELRRITTKNYKGKSTTRDHAKIYAFEYASTAKTAFAIGTYNLDVQSFYGSNEHLILFDDTNGDLTQKWLADMWDKGSVIGVDANNTVKEGKQKVTPRLAGASEPALISG